jgi:hypothetical protein
MPEPASPSNTPPGEPTPIERHALRIAQWGVFEKGLAIVATLLTLATGILAFQTTQLAKEKDEAQQIVQDGRDEIASFKSQVATLEAENGRLKDEILRQSSGTTSDNNSQSQDSPTERHSGVITLRGEEVDLDAPSGDPRWRLVQGGDADLRTETNGYLGVLGNSMYLPLRSKEPNYSVCSTTTGYQTGGGFISGFREGENYCFITSENRYVAARLLEVTNDYYTFDVTTFDPPAR